MRKGQATRETDHREGGANLQYPGVCGQPRCRTLWRQRGSEKGGLYRHFAGKEELAAEAFRYALAGAVRVRTEKLDSAHGAVKQLKSIVQRFVEAPSSVPGGCPLMNTAVDADDGNPLLRELASKGFADWRERLSAVVREGLERGEIREGTEPRRVANTMIATLEGALMMSRLDGNSAALEDARASLDVLLEGIRGESSQPTA